MIVYDFITDGGGVNDKNRTWWDIMKQGHSQGEGGKSPP